MPIDGPRRWAGGGRGAAVSVLLLVLVLGGAAALILRELRRAVRLQVASSLVTIQQATHAAARQWAAEQRAVAGGWAAAPALVGAAEQLLRLRHSAEALRASPDQGNVRSRLTPPVRVRGYLGAHLIADDATILAALQDTEVGSRSVVAELPGVLQRVFAGETLLTRPLPEQRARTGSAFRRRAAIFALAPVTGSTGVVAALAFQLSPDSELTPLMERGWFAGTGESYAFDGDGRLLTTSRFDRQLRQAQAVENAASLRLLEQDPGAGTPALIRPVRSALQGESGIDLEGYPNARGATSIGAWSWDPDLKLGFATEQAEAEAYQPFDDARQVMLLALACVILVAAALLWQEARGRRAAERLSDSLRAAEARYRLLAEHASDIVSLQDSEGRLLYVSPSGSDVFPPPERGPGRTADLAVHPDDLDATRAARAAALESDRTASVTHRLAPPGGEWGWFETVYRAVAGEDGRPRLQVASRDVTQRRRLEDQLIQSQKLETAGRLAGGVAHDFNNLLTAIQGYAEILHDTLPAEHPVQEDVAEIRRTTERAASLTGQLLAFARRQITRPRLIDLNEMIVAMDRLLRRVLGADIELVTVPGDALGAVRGDRPQLEQILLNLAVNARDAMPEGGKLTIETSNVELDENYGASHAGVVPGEYVLLAVSDTGHGMEDEVKAHIFEPFFTTKAQGKGTGLGLATCYGIVAQNRGHIWFYSEPGAGSTFKVYLPRVRGTAEAEAAPAAPARGGSETILLVEDEPAVRRVTASMLRGRGYTVVEAASGPEALALAQRQPIHALVTDIVMPQMGGRELALRLLRQRPALRVLFISGYTENAIVHRGELDPGVFFLQKPYTGEELARVLREVLDGEPPPPVEDVGA